MPANQRKAICLEYAHLLVCLYRNVGITAYVKGEVDHAYVVAEIDGKKYKFDPAQLKTGPYNGNVDSERESISNHYVNEGISFAVQQKYDAAYRCFERAIILNPNSAAAWCNKGKILYLKRKFDDAIKCYNRSIHLNPKYPMPWKAKGKALLKLGRYGEAEKCFLQAKKLEELQRR